MLNKIYHMSNLQLFNLMRAQKVRFDLCYADMMFDQKTQPELAWIEAITEVASPTATIYIHTDQRSVCEVRDAISAAELHLQAWIIWAYDWGGRPRNMWAPKHDDILVATVHPTKWTFNAKQVSVPKVTMIRSTKDWKIPTDVWTDIPIVHTMSKEKDRGEHRKWQKPERLLERIILASSNEGHVVLDPFSGTGTTAYVAKKLGRNYIACDTDKDCVRIGEARCRT